MNDVEELLNTWELPDLVPVFKEQQITIQALSALNESDFKELIPLAGPRALFLRCWRSWKIEFTGSCNSNILENLLKSSLETSVLLSCKGGSLSGDSARNLLATTIAKEILSQKVPVINGAIYYKWAGYIKELFPGERTTTYYIPACTTANGVNIQARGKLVHQVLNKRRRLQLLGALPRKRSRSSSSTKSNPSPGPLPSVIADNTDNEEESVSEDLQWLQSSSSPWSLVEERWKRTVDHRLNLILRI